ncbi:TPA: hypothetical protein HA259_08105 [Thermoplasmata archaeon]|nr:hypothetical protein [Thermoplasmata archaeon]
MYRPTPSKKPGKGRGKAILTLAIIVIAAIVVSVLVYTYLIAKEEGNTPEEAFLSMVNAVNDGDARAFVECSVLCFADDELKDSEMTYLEVYWAESGTVTLVIHSYQVLTGDDSAYLQELLDDMAEFTESTFSVNVEDCCAILANFTSYHGGDSYSEEAPFLFVKIETNWYLAFPEIPQEGTVIEY